MFWQHRKFDFRLLLIGLHLLWGALQVALLFPSSGAARRDELKRRWSRQLLARLGIQLAVEEKLANIRGGLLVCNHISFIDVFVINACLPCGFVAKSEVARWPLIGWLCRNTGTLFIERGSRIAIQRTREHMHEVLSDGQRLVVFPEGTTSAGDRVLPFHAALLQSAIDTGANVHVLALSYHDAQGKRSIAPAYYNQISMIDCLRQTLAAKGLAAQLRIAAHYAPPHPDRRHLAHHAHQAVATALGL